MKLTRSEVREKLINFKQLAKITESVSTKEFCMPETIADWTTNS